MSDPFNSGDDVVSADGVENSIGGVNAGQISGNPVGANDFGGLVGDTRLDELDVETDPAEMIEEHGFERLNMEELAEQKAENERLAELDRADQEERERQEAEKNAARDEAHANDEAFLEDEWTSGGETYQEWSLPDSTTIVVDSEGNAVSVEWPPGEGPVYVGDVLIGGEAHAVYDIPGSTQIVVDDQGNTVGTLDEVDVDDMSVPLYWITGDEADAGVMVTVELVPDPDGSYDTIVRDAESGEPLKELDTGSEALGYNVGQTDSAEEGQAIYQTYSPPGSEHQIVIDEDGVVVGTHPITEEPEWSILGIVEYYEDGTIAVDVGVVNVAVDVVGPDGGIEVGFDVLIVKGTAGIEWNEDGSWEFDTSIDVDVPGTGELRAAFAAGQDADGMWYVDAETFMEMQIGLLSLEGGQHFHFQQTPDGFEMNVGWEGSASVLGFYASRTEDLTFVKDEDGTSTTYSNTYGAGHEMVGGIEVTNEFQVRTSEDGVEAGMGIHGAVVDDDGDAVVEGGAYADTEHGLYTDEEKMDDGRDYERQYRDMNLPNELSNDPEELGRELVEGYGIEGAIAGQEGEERRFGREPVEHRMNVEIGMAATGVPPVVAAAAAGHFGEIGASAGPLLRDVDVAEVPEGIFIETWINDVHDGALPEGSSVAWTTSGLVLLDDETRGFASWSESTNPVFDRDDRDVNRWNDSTTSVRERPAPDTTGAQTTSAPPPPDDPPAEEDGPTELPKIWARRDGDATTPDEEEPVDPKPDPKPADERPKLFERDPKPTDGNPPDDGPVVGGPKVKPEIWTERVRDTDADGDGIPDDRFDPNDPIMTDEPSLEDVVLDGPPTGSTVSAGPDQSSGTLERPEEGEEVWTDWRPEGDERRAEPTGDGFQKVEVTSQIDAPTGDRLGNFEIQDVVRPDRSAPDASPDTDEAADGADPAPDASDGAGDGDVAEAQTEGYQLPDGYGEREHSPDRDTGSFGLEDDIAPMAPVTAVDVVAQDGPAGPAGPDGHPEDPVPPQPAADRPAVAAEALPEEVRPIEPVAGISGGLDGGEVAGISGGLDGGEVAGISGGLDGGEDQQQISGGLDGGEESIDG